MSTAVAVAHLLATNGFGVFPSDTKWSINVGAEPDVPEDGCVTVYDTGGLAPDTDQLDRRPTFQVRVRTLDYAEGYARLEAIAAFLQVRYGYTHAGRRYASFEAASDILPLGRDDRNAFLFTLNLRVSSSQGV